MFEEDLELINEFVTESREGLSTIEADLLEIESRGADVDVDLVNRVFRAIHSIKGASGFLGLETIGELAHTAENVLSLIREGRLVPTGSIVNALLKSADRLNALLDQATESNGQKISDEMSLLKAILEPGSAVEQNTSTGAAALDRVDAAAQLVADLSTELKPTVTTAPSPETAAAEPVAAAGPEIAVAPPAAPVVAAVVSPALAATVASAAPAQPAVAKPAAAQPASTPDSAGADAERQKAARNATEASVRVTVNVLDRLMNLAGELVLGRNQLLQVSTVLRSRGLEHVAARLDQVTSELQDTIMQTRMQPVGTVFNKFTRIVRDLGQSLHKECQLVIEGQDVELDRTIIEGIGDPLTHLVRNAMDHGLETAEERVRAGKSPTGQVALRAYHREGKVFLEIADDGHGIDAVKLRKKAVEKRVITPEAAASMSDHDAVQLIFHAGFSTAEQVTAVSGRGVGMDVVRTNLEKLGGSIEIDTVVGKGTTFRIQLPLTLAIIPSLIVRGGDSWFAIPQLNVAELVRLRAHEIEQRIQKIRESEVLKLRGELLPLVRLCDVMNLPAATPTSRAQNLIVLQSGAIRFALAVDELGDPEEIVVKPLGRHLQQCRCLAGAAVLGDGKIALIADISGIATAARLSERGRGSITSDHSGTPQQEAMPLLLFRNDPSERFAIPQAAATRIERIHAKQILTIGGQQVLHYRGGDLPLLTLEECISAKSRPDYEKLYVVVVGMRDREIGIVAPRIDDIRNVTTELDSVTFREPGVVGSLVLGGETVRLVDPYELIERRFPKLAERVFETKQQSGPGRRVLLAEDSPFFRTTIREFLTSQGFEVRACENGRRAWEALQAHPSDFDVVLTDIEMPEMNGFELCTRIRGERQFASLPVIACTTLDSGTDRDRGKKAGFTDYLIKLNRSVLINSILQVFPPQQLHGSRT